MEKLEEAEEDGSPMGNPTVSTDLETQDLSDMELPPIRYHTAAEASDTCIIKDCLIWPKYEKMHLTLKSLEAPGSGEVW